MSLHTALRHLIDDRANDERIYVADLHNLLAANPEPVSPPAPAGLREALAELAEMWISRGPTGSAISDVRDLLARFPAPVLPDGAVPVGDEARWERQDDGRWRVCVSGKTWTRAAYTDDALREMGVPVPEPAPQITVGCIVDTGDDELSVEAIVHGRAILWDKGGRWWGSWPVDDLTFVAPDRASVGWDPIKEER